MWLILCNFKRRRGLRVEVRVGFLTTKLRREKRKEELQGYVENIMNIAGKIERKNARIGIIGLGYVGLPLAIEFCRVGFQVSGFDVDESKVLKLALGKSYIKHIDSNCIADCGSLFFPTNDFTKLAEVDCIIVCVPTPLSKNREPDMSYVFNTTRVIAQHLRKDQMVILESTTYPGTTDEDMRVILEATGLLAGQDFFLAYSPEREDPNNQEFSTRIIPKVIGGYTKQCLDLACALYGHVFTKLVPVTSTRVAEATKLLENIYRSVNIAMVNELKMLFDRMGIDIWEVIDAAKTKPFGFQAFYPGPGLGGHCIPIDPFYLTWKAREYDMRTKFIELAGEINTSIPYYVVEKTIDALNERGKSIKGVKILILGLAYKKDVDDVRESPSFKLIELFQRKGVIVDYSDPYVSETHKMRHYDYQMRSISLTAENLRQYDAVVIATDHSHVDYSFVVAHATLVIDTRNATKYSVAKGNIVKA